MIPEPCKKRVRTGWRLLLLITALTLRLSLTAQALPRIGQSAQALLDSPKLLEAALFFELGVTPPDPTGSPSGGAAERSETEGAGSPSGGAAERSETEGAGSPSGGAAEQSETEGAGSPSGGAAEQSETEGAVFLPSEAQALTLRGNCSYKPDLAALLLAPTELSKDTTVLIVHTHASEAYTPSPGCEYEPSADYRTLEPAHSVIAVGEALAEELRARGVTVIHDTALNDYPSYNDSYANARARIEAQLREHPEIGMVLDLHRDALDAPVREEAALSGEVCAPMMLVVGTDEGGLTHPDWQENLANALKLQALLERGYPGLMKPISLRRERFNGDLTPASLIVEVGSTENTLPEAKLAVRALAQAVAALLGAGSQS